MDTSVRDAFIESWQEAVESHELPQLTAHFGEQMSFSSPAIYKSSSDRKYIDQIIGFVAELIEDFHYTEIHPTEDGAVMIFEGHCGGTHLEGIDLFRLHPDGKVAELRVFIRPMNALSRLMQEMMKRFQDAAGKPS